MKKIDKGTICRTILQLLVYINQGIAIIGSTSFAQSITYQWISFAVTVLITAMTYWYNNDWTSIALCCRDVFDALKDGKLTKEEVETFIKNHSLEDEYGHCD